ncbi:hypothetical protein L2E82_05192 [Cichorium intybus]|uniref:Uncharacterized protein n=1 Tax=Cichorium intybus TaxID=13427 RepID=A0ACB9H6E7_CICIN|nr:hypothetical protein L2E82_05192 [Cichorium intybus]
MVRGSSQSQTASSSSNSRPGPVGAVPRGSPAATAGLRRRRLATGSSSGFSNGSGGNSGGNMLRFYTDDAPGIKITPTVVLVMSVLFIGFVTALTLHVFGKLYRRSSVEA